MLKGKLLLYIIAFTIPMLLGLNAWQSVRYTNLERQARVLEADQENWVENNKRLIADIATITSSEEIENIARYELNLEKIRPENVLQIWIDSN